MPKENSKVIDNSKSLNKYCFAIAHPSKLDNNHQRLSCHLNNVSRLTARFSTKCGNSSAGEIIGLLHDFGKYSSAFQQYMQLIISENNNNYNPDKDEVDSKSLKGKIDHSTAGAQWLTGQLGKIRHEEFKHDKKLSEAALVSIKILFLCIASHHSGLIDNLPELNASSSDFHKRIQKGDAETHLTECTKNIDDEVLLLANQIIHDNFLTQQAEYIYQLWNQHNLSDIERDFYIGMYTKFLFSCLIDADRIDSADFDIPENKQYRHQQPDWSIACERVESFISSLKIRNNIDTIRAKISDNCLNRSTDSRGIYSLTVPTGGGKTYASLRFAVNHAKTHQLDRIFYIIPYTSIIEQNADAIRKILERDSDAAPWILEHHSNLEPEIQTWRSKLASENWDAPIVLTTMVQFLESLFGSGTRGVRRLHQLANSVLIFDEIQTLPIRCVNLFNNAINYLTRHCGATAVMCTATQPLLHHLPEEKISFGQLALDDENELTPNIQALYQELERVNLKNCVKDKGWNVQELSVLIKQKTIEKTNCLVIVNTKKWAKNLFQEAKKILPNNYGIYHLSTSQCPAHRKKLLDEIRARLDNNLPTLCVSTQLIEAGVDIDFNCVIRFKAGLDSIAQAAGRCNRNGRLDKAEVLIVNPDNENLNMLQDIKSGIAATERILNEFPENKLLSPEAMTQYFAYYFYDRHNLMHYPTKENSLISMLSSNKFNISALNHAQIQQKFIAKNILPIQLNQSFMTASKIFKAIDAPTQAIIVPYNEEAKSIIEDLLALDKKFDSQEYRQLLKQSQKYSVNLFPNVWQSLFNNQAIYPISDDEAVYCLHNEYYSQDFGVSAERCGDQEFYIA
ncbi:CRISPR-associated helicase/endonuclease Cas3 [Providencia burhodogranariea]|uniref:CRISPR-associated helicase Cas3 domain-containing protein n=1 Tax=Providencia burhodogranariea DSM 19968 TaxID=1141662 RepID=K8X558_9GAMM|nr:CRISPR-associated helicase/endonuclease Cas3 [Providencia burhodogranariea]EKT63595.1 CRISPR-associated helicase Cas3 domain-containing protein [Providencia burhodogranariea DSM 19968]